MESHYFLALPVPAPLTQPLNEWLLSRRAGLPFKNWVAPEDYHITLHFLGKASVDQRAQIHHDLPSAIEKIPCFTLQATHFGFFGEQQAPRIFWVGLEQEEELNRLQKESGVVCQRAGFTLETRPYRPHITVARRWQGTSTLILPFFDEVGKPSNWTWIADRVVLYQTHLDRTPKYEAIQSYGLNKVNR
ncbi:RNA 2',3'-cyclic phosphodiesterase [Ammoniphilus sp. CFH 90114]|uniref:RNA 2',3'-cyclic phosphodiesterase n=1 Tax=Ammoniphilus sp. CFH 90114 TaxID=2493665 RepID=UPI00100DED9E|nr:RNA 2',3'-cyclic phosphodiesterase [Ammoniphilus sp. CFH 90114]RXT15297.1 RNA 2',3'-cyclic phosphodiesterase [Ammoniphilus sp. CFH 90114]